MRSIEELKSLYSTTLEERLKALETQRKKIKKTIFSGAVILLAVFLLAGSILGEATMFVLIAGIIVIAILVGGKISKYRAAFKKEVVAEIVKLIDESWHYNSDNHVSVADYHSSKIFTNGVDRHKGDDYVKGFIQKTAFEFSELHTEYKTTTTDSKGNTKTSWHTIFKGLFFHADFNKHLKAETLVLPDTAQRLFGKLGQSFQKMSGRGDLVKLENNEFEKLFVVYGSDQIEARYILTPVLMEKMVELKKKYNHHLHFSFVGSRVYCGMSISKNMFEPCIFKSGVRFEDVQEMHDYFAFIEVMIQEMNLNTRIWTKD
jgi:hypothetical protein